MPSEQRARIAYLHVGTHKTGTTSLQAMLAENDALLARSGIHVPVTARVTPGSAGHHNIAWELNNPYQFDPEGGTLDALLDEIAQVAAPTVCISSEEFELLAADPDKLRKLAAALRSVGYEPHVIIYLRPQADYIESLYAEIVKRWTVDLREFLGRVLTDGVYGESWFDYDRLVGAFERAFGPDRVHVRAYDAAAPTQMLLREFLTILRTGGPEIAWREIQWPERLNERLTCDKLLGARLMVLAADAGPEARDAADELRRVWAREAFEPLTLPEIASIAVHFWPSNDRVARRHNVRLSGASLALGLRELMTLAMADRAEISRKRISRTLDVAVTELRQSLPRLAQGDGFRARTAQREGERDVERLEHRNEHAITSGEPRVGNGKPPEQAQVVGDAQGREADVPVKFVLRPE
jgi:hypothetical protein